MDEQIVIAVLAGTVREGRRSIAAAQWLAEFGRQQPNVETVLVDPKDFHFPADGDNADTRDPRYTDIITRADAFVIVAPEYNHSIPSSLKRMLDSEGYDGYRHKPVALVGVSNGSWGGVRVCEALLPVCHTLWLVNIKPELYFPRIQDIFDESGAMKPEFVAAYTKNAQAQYNELIWMARLFKAGRRQLESKTA